MHDQGTLTSKTTGYNYVGNWIDNRYHGYGVETDNKGNNYLGYFINGKREGQGIHILQSKDFAGYKYEG